MMFGWQTRMPFGIYRGDTVSAVFKKDPDYLRRLDGIAFEGEVLKALAKEHETGPHGPMRPLYDRAYTVREMGWMGDE